MKNTAKFSRALLVALAVCVSAIALFAQGTYRSQIRGVVSDSSGAVVRDAKVTITESGTNITSSIKTNDKGEYFFTSLRPSTYSVKVEAQGFRPEEQTGIVLAVDQQSSLNFTLSPGSISTEVQVNTTAPLLDTGSSTLGTEVTNQYIKEIPLPGRNFFGLAFLSGGVTETAGSGTTDNYPSGTNFVSNGQRNATAEVRIDGSLISAPEQGEGATSNVYYEPSVEVVQEFKVQNNSFSAEFGNNGGTVVNMALKSGTNNFHGSGWWFGQRSGTDARDFFNPEPNEKPKHVRDQYGFSVGGPIIKNKTFFFGDIEKVRNNSPVNIDASVPTLAERTGDFSGTVNPIYDPIICQPNCQSRPQVGSQPGGTLNVIPQNEIDPIGQAMINLYPKPNLPGEFNNFRTTVLSQGGDYQFDIKVDHQLSSAQRLSARYSRLKSHFSTPTVLGDGDTFSDGIAGDSVTAQNASLEYAWTINPRVVWTNHFAIDRVREPVTENYPTLTSVGLPSYLAANSGIDRMPTIGMCAPDGGCSQPWSSLYDQCCTDTNFAHTLYSYSSQLLISHGSHLMTMGGEQRVFFNNFFQPPNPTGLFNFTDDVTSGSPNSGAGCPPVGPACGSQGNPFASLLFGYPDNGSSLNIYPAVANKSIETGFYFQDDWKVNSKLTLNLGMRYEWSTPYTERSNRIEFSDFTGDSGMNIDLSSGNQLVQDANGNTLNFGLQALGVGPKQLVGTTLFPNTAHMRHVPVDRNNWGPRLGFAYQLDQNTVLRGGAGVYYGMSVATNFQYPGTAFRKSATMFFTTDNFNTRAATLSDPFHGGVTGPQGETYGKLAEWGYANGNDLGTTEAQNADIYQWNLGIQRLLPSQIVIAVDYSANRSTHLPFGGYSSTRNRDFISSALLAKLRNDPNFLAIGGTGDPSDSLATPVTNPFCSLFGGSGCAFNAGPAIFNEPDSQYGNPTLPLVNLLRPYPQFDGDFEGLPRLVANSWYNSMQIRFQKRTTHHVSFEGSYTFSKFTDNSSTGANAFVGTLNNGNPQQLDNLAAEHSISANDTPHRLAAAVVFDLPIGRDRWIGSGMNRVLDAVIGGWSVSTLVSEQSGQPLSIYMSNNRLQDGNQRPNVLCGGSTGIGSNRGAVTQLPVLNLACFADPGDQVPGDGPRYFSGLRTDGIHNFDANLYKEFTPREGMTLQLRAEVFNTFNTPRFAPPDTSADPGNPQSQFGLIESTASGYSPRSIQFGVRFEF
ncbi:MAG TPA: carboxypeptidase-like regulatory domain-containing protein [Terriglobales bacterium]|nr:carboxypeptidase-like regulatory domain-containing protein [Terriglobales bacterium]